MSSGRMKQATPQRSPDPDPHVLHAGGHRDQKGFSMSGPVGSLKLPSTPEEEDLVEASEDMGDEDMQEEDIEENSEEDREVRSKRSSADLDGKRP